MASTPSRPADAGASPCPASFNPARLELLHDVQPEAEKLNRALLAVLELLRGCAPGHRLSAGGLLLLLEPIAGGLDTLSGDLRTVCGTTFHH